MAAVAQDDAAMVELLLKNGADINLEEDVLRTQYELVRLYISQCDERVRMLAGTNIVGCSNLDTFACSQPSRLPTFAVNGPSQSSPAGSTLGCWSTPPELFETVLEDPHGVSQLEICLKGGSDPSQPVGAKHLSPLVLIMDHAPTHCDTIQHEEQLVERVALLLRYGCNVGFVEFSCIVTKAYWWCDIMEEILLLPECLSDPLKEYIHEIREAVKSKDAARVHQIVPAAFRTMKKRNPAFKVSKDLRHVLFASSFAGDSIEQVVRVLFEDGFHVNSPLNITDLKPFLQMGRFHMNTETHYRTEYGRVLMTPLNLLLEWKGPTGKHQDICQMRLRVLRFLIDAGSEVNTATTRSDGGKRWTPLELACVNGGCFDEVKYLIEAGARVDTPAPYFWGGRSALQAAADEGNLEVVEYLIAQGADVNAPAGEYKGATALQYAAGRGSFHIVQVLLEAGADIDAPGAKIEGRKAIEMAAEHGRFDCLHYLLDKYDGQTPISEVCEKAGKYARREGHHFIAKFLSTYPSERATRY